MGKHTVFTHTTTDGEGAAIRVAVTKLREVAAAETGLTDRPGLAATVEVTWPGDARTYTLNVSRLHGEEAWIADALFDDTRPVFCNGLGSRVTAPRAVTHPAVLDALKHAERRHDARDSEMS